MMRRCGPTVSVASRFRISTSCAPHQDLDPPEKRRVRPLSDGLVLRLQDRIESEELKYARSQPPLRRRSWYMDLPSRARCTMRRCVLAHYTERIISVPRCDDRRVGANRLTDYMISGSPYQAQVSIFGIRCIHAENRSNQQIFGSDVNG
jgi:hypothetical protein